MLPRPLNRRNALRLPPMAHHLGPMATSPGAIAFALFSGALLRGLKEGELIIQSILSMKVRADNATKDEHPRDRVIQLAPRPWAVAHSERLSLEKAILGLPHKKVSRHAKPLSSHWPVLAFVLVSPN